jgi:biotin carboxyl carrier protein
MPRHDVVSPVPGVFYRRPDPDSPPFAEDGSPVTDDSPVGLVEIMKSFHQISAGATGTVVEFLVEDEDEVDAGQSVAVVETA